MTVKEMFNFIKGVRPGFAFTDAQLTVWLNEIEGHVQTDIWLLEPAVDETQTGLVEYDSTIDPETGEMVDANHELLVPFPWNKLYRYFLLMSIDLANGEYQRYANSYELFNEAYEEYAGWYAQHVSPANGDAITRGYYISAYQFAARGGYAGTEKEFYETLGRVSSIEANAESAAASALTSATDAEASADEAHMWANGGEAGVPSETNNAKHYAEQAKAHYGAPLVALTAAEMEEQDRVYVYVGNETGYTNGNWYYFDGGSWVSGGVYNSTAFETDTTLSYEGLAADAAAVGDRLGRNETADKKQTEYLFSDASTVDIGSLIISGAMNPVNGNNAANTNKQTRTGYIAIDSVVVLWANSQEYLYTIWGYNGTSTSTKVKSITRKEFVSDEYIIIDPAEGFKNIRIGFKRVDDADLTTDTSDPESDYYKIKNAFRFGCMRDTYQQLTTRDMIYLSESEGHVTVYNTNTRPLPLYKEVNGTVVPGDVVYGSDYIKVNNTDYINIIMTGISANTIGGCACYVYFYDAYKNIVWSILNYTDDATGIKNKVGINALKTINGFQFTNIPTGYYIRVAAASNTICYVVVWDGKAFGYPLTAMSTVFDENINKVGLPSDASACIQVPDSTLFLIAKPGYTFVGLTTSNDTITEEPPDNTYRFPAQALYLRNFSGAARIKNVKIVRNYNYVSGEHDLVMPNGDISEYVVSINRKRYSPVRSSGYARNKVIEKINQVMNISWTPTANVVSNSGSTFHEGVTYTGIPYRSAWTTASCVGWHITKHTFINAVNDPDSIFYHNPSVNKPGPYYSLVCSSFASLVTGFNIPYSNWGLVHSPDVRIKKTSQPAIGELMTNAFGHCFVPVEINTTCEGDYALTIAEQEGPITKINTVLNGVSDDWSKKGIGKISSYVNNYQYCCSQDKWDNNIPYSLTYGTIRNGSARPYLGDRCVFTSAMDVKINIKNENATRLYYQKFNVTTTHGIPGTFTANGDPSYIEIEVGTNQVVLRSKTTDNSYSGVNLEDGAVYGIWASVDDAQTTAPSNVEYFEWHDVTTTPISYNVVNGVLVTDDVFWYVVTEAFNYIDVYKEGIIKGNMTIPYNAPGKTISGTPLAHSDYSKYAEKAYIKNITQDYNPVWAFFRQGKFGAYVVGKYVDDTSEDPSDEPTDDGESSN